MITTAGKRHIKRYLAGLVPSIGDSIAIGVGPKAEAVGDTNLQFESERIPVDIVSYDFENDRLVFKTSLPDYYAGTIYEVGLFYGRPAFNTKMLTTVEATEPWSFGSNVAFNTNTRIGSDALRFTPAANGSASATLGSMAFDLSQNTGSDKVMLGVNSGNANVSSLVLRLKTDNSNHFAFTWNGVVAGYNVAEATKSMFSATGTPNWANITSVEVVVNSKASGASQLDLDAIKIQGQAFQDYTMISRELLQTPYTKIAGLTQDIEFTLDVNI